jgi:hypothetical protein
MAWLAVAVASLVAFAWLEMDMLGDAFWYIATGRYVLEHGLPNDELFSYTGIRGPWFVNMPVSEPLFAWIMDHLGVWALMGMATVVFGLALSLFWLPHTKGTLARWVTWPLVVFTIYVQREDLSVRSQTFADVAIAVVFLCLFRVRDGARVPRWLPFVLGAVWINVHPSVLVGVLVPLAFAVATQLGPPQLRARSGPYALFGVSVLAGAFANPYGYRLVLEIVRFTTAESTTTVDLFRSPDFARPDVAAAFVLSLAAVVACFRGVSSRAGVPEGLVMAATITATCVSRRYIEIMMAFCIVLAGRLLRDVEWPPLTPERARSWAVALMLPPLALAAASLRPPKDPWQNVPVEAARFIEEHKLPDNVMNIMHWGGYLDYAWRGHRRIFMDGRTTQFENGVLLDHTRFMNVAPAAGDILDAYLVNTVLWERGSPVDHALAVDPAWTEVYRKGIAVVYVRKNVLQ